MKLRLHYDKVYFDCLSKEQSTYHTNVDSKSDEEEAITVTHSDIKRITYNRMLKTIAMLGFCLSMNFNTENFYDDGYDYNDLSVADDVEVTDDDVGVFVSAPIPLTGPIASTRLVSEKHFYKLISRDSVALQLFESIGLFTRSTPQCPIVVIIPIFVSNGDIAMAIALPNERFGFIFDSTTTRRSKELQASFKLAEANLDLFVHYLCQHIKPIPKSFKATNTTVYHTSKYPELMSKFSKYPFYYFCLRFRRLLDIIKDQKNGLFKRKDEFSTERNNTAKKSLNLLMYNSKRSAQIVERIIKEISAPRIDDVDDELSWMMCGNFVFASYCRLKLENVIFNNPFFKSMRPTAVQTKHDWLRKSREEQFKALKNYTQVSKEYADKAKARTEAKTKRETEVSDIDPALFGSEDD